MQTVIGKKLITKLSIIAKIFDELLRGVSAHSSDFTRKRNFSRIQSGLWNSWFSPTDRQAFPLFHWELYWYCHWIGKEIQQKGKEPN